MGLANNLTLIIRIWLAAIIFQYGHSENVEPRALELSVPWRPIPYHVPQQQQPQQSQQLISVASFDTTSKDELVHIAQHNAQILKQFNQPIAQYSQHPQGGMKVQITTHQQAPGPSPAVAASVQQQHHQQPHHHHHLPPHHHHHQVQGAAAPSFGHTPAGPPKYMTTPLLQTIYPAAPHKQQQQQSLAPPQSKPFVKSDQITTLNMVHSSTPKVTAAISTHGAVGVKSGKFNGQFRDTQPSIGQKSTLKPHPVMNKLQSHMGFRQKQQIATSSNRLEQFINPSLYGTYIQFGQSPSFNPAALAPSKTKFFSQLSSGVPSFDTQTLKSFFNAPGGYTPSVGQFKKLNFIQQQQQLQPSSSGKYSFPHFNQIPADLAEFPKKYVTPSSAEKELTKTGSGGLDSTPLFPHLPPSVLTPFFQQVQQQQQQHSSSSGFISGNKYNNFNLKTQHPAPPVSSSQSGSSGGSSTKHSFSQHPFPSEHESLSNFGGQFSGGAFSAYSTQQPLPIEHKPFEIVKFKESPGKQLSTKFNEIHDEYSKNLVPPPPSTQQAFLPTVLNHLSESSPSKDPIEILNKYNINPHSPLQDANRFSYDFPRPTPSSQAVPTSGPAPTTVSTTTTTTTQLPTATTLPRQQYFQHHYNQFQQFPGEQSFHSHHQSFSPVLVTPLNELSDNGWLSRDKYLTTEKPNVFKNLFRPVESEYKQHKLMHPAYTGLPPNRRPSATPSSTTTSTFASAGGSTTNSPWDQSTEEPIITHSFFTIEDAIADPTLIPPKSKNKYKYTTDAEEENRQEDLQLEIVTIGPYFGSEESPIQQVVTTPAPSKVHHQQQHGSKGGNGQHRRRRPKPHHQSSTTTEYTTEQDSTESTTNAINPSINTIDNRNRNRIRFRPKPITTATPPAIVETEPATTILPTPPPLPTFVSSEEFDGAAIKKFRKKPLFTRNRFNVLNQRGEEEKNSVLDLTEPSLATPTLTTISSTSTSTAAAVNTPAEAAPSISPIGGGGFRSRYRPAAPQQPQKGKDSQEDLTQPIGGDGTKLNSRLPSRPTSVSSTVASSVDPAAVFNSDESSLSSSNENRTRGGENNRPRFSIKEYRNKLNRTVSTAGPTSTVAPSVGDLETTTAPKLRFPTRNRFLVNARLNKTVESNDILPTGTGGVTTEKSTNETTTRSSFRPHGTRTYNRFTVKKPSTETPQTASTSAGTSTRGQPANGNLANRGRTKTAYDQAVAANRTLNGTYNTTASLINRRPPKITLRQRIQNYNRKKEMEQGNTATGDGNMEEPLKRDEVADIPSIDQNSVLASSGEQNRPIDDLGTLGDRFEASNGAAAADEVTTRASSSGSTTEGYRHHETSIMKISPKDPNSSSATATNNGDDYDLNSASSDYSKRVVELTLSGTGSKDRGNFKSVNKGLLSRKVPGYFTLATEDPILPIEAFFPQVKKPNGLFA